MRLDCLVAFVQRFHAHFHSPNDVNSDHRPHSAAAPGIPTTIKIAFAIVIVIVFSLAVLIERVSADATRSHRHGRCRDDTRITPLGRGQGQGRRRIQIDSLFHNRATVGQRRASNRVHHGIHV